MKTMKTVVAVAFTLALTAVQTASAKTVEIASGGDIAAAITEATSDDTPAEVVLGVGDYAPKATVSIGKAVVVRGKTGNPADVRVSGSKARQVFSLTANATAAVVRDLTIENGLVSQNTRGTGIAIESGTVSNCVVRNCRLDGNGGGGAIYLNKSTAFAYNCVVTNNYLRGGNGGGGYGMGAGLRIDSGTAVNCYVADNWTSGAYDAYGAGVYVGAGKVVNCTVVNNRGNVCGGVYVGNNGAKVANCLIWGNTAGGAGGTITTDIYNNNASCFTKCIARVAINANCFAADDWPVGDVGMTPLAATSAHDASGAVSGVNVPPFDVWGHPRRVGEGIDIGAVENQENKPLAAVTMSSRQMLGVGSVTFSAMTENVPEITGYTWDFDDGTTDTASGASATHIYDCFGVFNVRLTVHAQGGDFVCPVANTMTVLPKSMHVVKGNEGASYPYADEETAAPDIATALSAAVSGQEIVVHPETYVLPSALTLSDAITIRGSTGRPEEVRISGGGARSAFVLSTAAAMLRDLTVENCLVGANTAGQGISMTAGVVSNCVIRGCKSNAKGGGGAIFLNGSNACVYNCVISNNYTSGGNGGGGNAYGGAIRMSNGKVANCLIAGNKVGSDTVYGTGAYIGNGTIANCTFANNVGNYCGGVYADGGTVVNCLFGGNSAEGATDETPYDVWRGTASKFDRCIARVQINGNCIGVADWPTADACLTPMTMSAAHDASKAVSGLTLPSTDLFGNPRQVGAGIDIGAIENTGTTPLVAVTVSSRSVMGSDPLEFTAWTDGLADITGYTWDFGDGKTDSSSGATALHGYADFGVYQVGLTVHTTSGDFACKISNSVSVSPKTIHVVKDNPTPVAPYVSEATAAPDLATALAVAKNGQEIAVHPETYPISANIVVSSPIRIFGTTGKPEDVVLKMTAGSQLFRVASGGAIVADLTLDGNKKSVGCGGALLQIDGCAGIVTNCILRNCNNDQYSSRGAVELSGDGALLIHSVVSNCVTGAACGYSNTYAGMMIMAGAKVSNCLIVGNRFEQAGNGNVAGVYVNGGSLVNCKVVGNTAKKIGGVRCDSGSVVNCAIVGNVSQDMGDDYANVNKGDDTRFSNCASDVKAIAGANCKFDSDKNAIFVGYANGNYAPASGSILRENGKDVANAPALDLAGNPRIAGEKIDIGAYEADLSKLEVKLNVSSSDAFVPATIVLTAVADGAEGATYEWTFGDGQTETTSEPSVSHVYRVAGDYQAGVKLTKGTDEVEDGVVLHVVPKIMRVKGDNKNAAFPYDTVDNAASNINQALTVAIADSVIEVEPGTVREPRHVRVEKRMTIRGRTGHPGDVTVRGNGYGGTLEDDWNFDLANAGASFESLTLVSPGTRHIRIDQAGGTVSNCVIRGDAVEEACYNHSDLGVVTHCVFSNITLSVNSGGGMGLKGVYASDKHGARLSNTLFVKCTANTSGNSYESRPSGIIDAWGTVEFCTVANCKMVKSEMPHVLFHNLYEEKSVTPCGKLRACVFGANKIGNELGLAIVRCKGATIENCVGDFAVNGLSRVATAEELFRRPAKGDWRLRANSPARDIIPKAELPADLPATDLGGNPRVYSVGLDAGCYECMSGGMMLLVR